MTDIFILLTTVGIIGFDVFLVGTKRVSISERLRDHGSKVHAIPFLWGALLGHFWGGNVLPWRLPFGVSLGGVLGLAGLAALAGRFLGGRKLVGLWGLVGAAAGAVLWPI